MKVEGSSKDPNIQCMQAMYALPCIQRRKGQKGLMEAVMGGRLRTPYHAMDS